MQARLFAQLLIADARIASYISGADIVVDGGDQGLVITAGVVEENVRDETGTRFYQCSFALLVERQGSENRPFRLFTPASNKEATALAAKDTISSILCRLLL